MAWRYYLTHKSHLRLHSSFPSLFGSINAKYSPFILGKIYLSIPRVAPILLAFLSPFALSDGKPLDFEGRKISQENADCPDRIQPAKCGERAINSIHLRPI
jgi:hypothetical protein